MTKEVVLEQLIALTKEKDHHKIANLSATSSLRDDLLFDSIELMEYVVTIEDAFSIDIPDEAVEKMISLGDMADFVLKNL